jgi:hypothetical protein
LTTANAAINDHYSNGPMQVGMHEPVDCSMDARSAAALGLFRRARLTVDVLDELHWRNHAGDCPIQPLAPDRGYLFWPATDIRDAPTAAREADEPGS